MHRFFISTIVATALTVTGVSATMAQAGEYRYVQRQPHNNGGNEAVAATLAGIAALFIIGKALEGNKDKHVATPPAPRKKVHKHYHTKRVVRTHRRHPPVMRKHYPKPRRHTHSRYSHWHMHSNGVRHIHPHGPGHHRGHH